MTNLKNKNFHPVLTFIYASDMVFCNSILLVVDQIIHKHPNENISLENKEKVLQMLSDLERTEDYCPLRFLIHKIAALNLKEN